jgi:G3E family GTPase
VQAKARDIYRSKGVLSIHGQGDLKFVFQGVHEQMNFGPSQETWKEGVRRCPLLPSQPRRHRGLCGLKLKRQMCRLLSGCRCWCGLRPNRPHP